MTYNDSVFHPKPFFPPENRKNPGIELIYEFHFAEYNKKYAAYLILYAAKWNSYIGTIPGSHLICQIQGCSRAFKTQMKNPIV